MSVRHERRVKEVVDGAGLYFSRLVMAGPYAFVGGVASDGHSDIASAARVEAPYLLSAAAHVVQQTTYIFDRYRDLLSSAGSGLDQMVQVEQWIPHKSYADGYLETSHGRGYLDRGRPASALLWTGDLMPPGATILPMGIAVIPGNGLRKEVLPASPGFHEGMTRPEFGETFQDEGPFNEVVTAGPFVFVVGDIAQNWETGEIEDGVRLPESTWWGSAIRNEASFLLTRLEQYLARAGCSMADVVQSSVYLNDIGDIFELDRVWRNRFPSQPPARSVIPVPGLGVPRREATHLQHRDSAVQMEHLTIALRPGLGVTREVISTGREGLMPQSEGVRAGQLLWISGQVAGGRNGLLTDSDINSQLDYIFDRIDEVCRAADTSLSNLVRLRGFVTVPDDAYAVYASLKRRVPSSPPTVGITAVPGPLPIPACTVMLDAVAFVPAI